MFFVKLCVCRYHNNGGFCTAQTDGDLFATLVCSLVSVMFLLERISLQMNGSPTWLDDRKEAAK